MPMFKIRLARPGEADALSALCRRSKAHWGYDAEFMRLSEPALAIAPALIETGRVVVAADGDDMPLGLASLAPLGCGVYDLLHMFVDPRVIGHGVGHALFAAVCTHARDEGASALSIMADPHAEAFYLRLGARRTGEAPSDCVPGRMLPMLEFDLS